MTATGIVDHKSDETEDREGRFANTDHSWIVMPEPLRMGSDAVLGGWPFTG